MKETAPLGCLLIFVSLVIFFGWAYVATSMSPELAAEAAEATATETQWDLDDSERVTSVSQYELDQRKATEWIAKNWSPQKQLAVYKEYDIEGMHEAALLEMAESEAEAEVITKTKPTRWGLNQQDWMTGVVAIWAILFVACCFGLGIGAFLIHDNGPDVLAVLGVYLWLKKPCYENDED